MSDNCIYVLVTGANAGVGYGICCRLLDEFVETRPFTQSINLTITTRSSSKSTATLSSLSKHITRTPRLKALSQDRVSFQAEHLDLTTLRSVLSASQRLLSSLPRLDILILNAGITGSSVINWPKAIWETILHPVDSVTYPTFAQGAIGALTKPQLPPSSTPEPPLGEVFCANVFGHYLLTHHLTPLLLRATNPRIIPISSLEAGASTLSVSDIQALHTTRAYHSSKRLTDILALTASQPSTKGPLSTFFPSPSPTTPKPKFYPAHPGICHTNIWPIAWFLLYLKFLSFYVARAYGSPWHTITSYKGACAAVWLALASQGTLDGIEERDGRGKWGSATDMWGRERVMRTEVEGWGFGGRVGAEGRFGKKGRRTGATDLTEEERAEFEALGREVWKVMEALRADWEERLGSAKE